jgi:hypothetical protein
MCGHQCHDAGGSIEPLRPGWYPAGNGYNQRYYAGRDRGWTDEYIVDIECRDPRNLHPEIEPSRHPILLRLVITASMAAVILIVLERVISSWG